MRGRLILGLHVSVEFPGEENNNRNGTVCVGVCHWVTGPCQPLEHDNLEFKIC